MRAYITGPWGTTYGSTITISPTSTYATYTIGQAACGGIVYYDAGSTQSWGRYLVAAPADFSGYTYWCSSGTASNSAVTGNYSSTNPPTNIVQGTIGYGKANTAAMVANCTGTGIGNVALAATQYSNGGYTDWFLPSFAELQALYVQRSLSGLGTMNTGYWASTEYSTTAAWAFNFNNGEAAGNSPKANYNLYARAIREF